MYGDTSAEIKREDKRYTKAVVSASGSLLLAGLSGALYASSSAVVKYMKNIHPAQLVFYRFCIITSLCLPELVRTGDNILRSPDSRIVIFARSFAASVAIFLHFIAFRYLPLGEAAVIASSYPGFTCIVARIFLKESFGLLQLISVAFTIAGMILISGLHETMTQNSSFYTTDRVYGLAAAFGAVFFSALYLTLTRRVKYTSHSILIFLSGILILAESSVVVLVTDKFRPVYRGLQQFLIIVLGIFGYCSSLTLIIATRNVSVGSVAIMRAGANICFGFLWQVILYHDAPSCWKILGGFLVCLSTVFIGFNKQINSRLPKQCTILC